MKRVTLDKACRLVLRQLHRRYTEKHGPSTAYLAQFRIGKGDTSVLSLLDKLEITDIPPQKGAKAYQVWNEMVQRGWLSNSHSQGALGVREEVLLTEYGFHKARSGPFQSVLDFANQNQGFAAYLALLLSLIALFT